MRLRDSFRNKSSFPYAIYNRALKSVKKDGLTLKDIPAELRASRSIVFAAVRQNPQALQYASKELQADQAIRVAMAAKPADGPKNTLQ